MSLALLVLLLPAGAGALESEECLACHDDAEMVGAELRIDPESFDLTAHGKLGCPACHESITEEHPSDGEAPSKGVCGDCHQDVAVEYAGTEHSRNAECGDCHNPHTVRSFREVSGVDMNRKCAACHLAEEMSSVHDLWLPQADLHLAMLPCISCHSGSENYQIVLYITPRLISPEQKGASERPAGYDELGKIAREGGIAALVDSDRNGFVTLAELKRFNSNPDYKPLGLKGVLTPDVATHDLQILDNRWDCTFCHASGPDAMQTSFLALPTKDGTFTRLEVEKGAVLDALYGTPDFYMLGATRNASMNLLGLAILACGLIMPAGHGLLRFLTRKNRR